MTDFIDEFVKIVKPWCDAPISFIEGGAYYLVSDLLGRFFRCTQLPHRGRPNLWIINSSIPGRFRRSTVQHYTQHVLKKTLYDYYKERGYKPEDGWETTKNDEDKPDENDEDKPDNKERKRYYNQLMLENTIEEGTPEGIADMITEADRDIFRITSTEIGGVFKRMQTRDYLSGVSTLLSKLYYGEGGKMSLSRRSSHATRTVPRGLYVTMFAGMQEPRWYLDAGMVRQGLLRRLIINYKDSNNRWKPPVEQDRGGVYKKLDDYAVELGERMIEYYETASEYIPHLIDINFMPDVKDSINNMARELDRAVDNKISNLNIYKQSLWEHKAKLAMVRSIAEGKIDKIEGHKPLLPVEKKHLQRADDYLSPVIDKAEDVLASLGTYESSLPTFEEPLDRLHRVISQSGREGLGRSDVYEYLQGVKSKEVDDLVATLIKQGKIEQIQGESTGGRPPILYRTVDRTD